MKKRILTHKNLIMNLLILIVLIVSSSIIWRIIWNNINKNNNIIFNAKVIDMKDYKSEVNIILKGKLVSDDATTYKDKEYAYLKTVTKEYTNVVVEDYTKVWTGVVWKEIKIERVEPQWITTNIEEHKSEISNGKFNIKNFNFSKYETLIDVENSGDTEIDTYGVPKEIEGYLYINSKEKISFYKDINSLYDDLVIPKFTYNFIFGMVLLAIFMIIVLIQCMIYEGKE